MCYQRNMHAWPLAKKWLLVHQYGALTWLRRGGQIARPPGCKVDMVKGVVPKASSGLLGSTGGKVGGKVSSTPVRTAYYYLWRDWRDSTK